MKISTSIQPWPALVIALLLTLAGCGGGGSADSAGTTPPPTGGTTPPPSGNTVVKNHVSGSVGDGPIVGARIRVFANTGALLQEVWSGITADYEVTINTLGTNYVLTIEADQGTDLVTGRAPDFKLSYAIYRPAERTIINLNPFSTLIFQVARTNGGIYDSTVVAARHAVVTRYGFGLDSALFPDPIETPIDDDNIRYIVKASETLGEMIRRTRDAIGATGWNVDGDFVVTALATDLADGWIDGKSAHKSSARLAAVANVASAAVLVEAMSNQLMVYGVNVTTAMDESIRQVRQDTPLNITTATVPIAANALQQAIRTLRAAQLVNPDSRIATTIAVMEAAKPGVLPAEIAAQLPPGIHGALRKATTDTAYASDAVINAVNLQARTSSSIAPPLDPDPDPEPTPPPPDPEPDPEPPPPPANKPPVISGSPSTSLRVGTAWSFTPNASDPDGDSLTFSITGRPSWMSFSSSTGRLSGTPSSSRIGTYSNIRISVSDGTATASLPSFSLIVSAPPPAPDPDPATPPVNRPPVISGSPNTSLVVGVPWSFTPNASDPDGDSLTFSITGRPSWMSFSSSTGRLSGTPSSSRIGTYSNIRISVSDYNQATTSLPAFSLTVAGPEQPLGMGSASLRWLPPTRRVDGTLLNAVGAYTLYYGRNASNLERAVHLGGSVTEYEVNNLERGTWYFAISASDSDGVESERSGMVSKTIP